MSRIAALLLLIVAASPSLAESRLVVVPAEMLLSGSADRHRFLVTLRHDDGSSRDVTTEAVVTSSSGVVAVEPGMLVPKADGTAKIEVSFDKFKTSATVTVREMAQTTGPSFLNDVMPVLTRMGCNQGACHGKGIGQNGFRLSLRGYAPDQDHRSITREFSSRRIENGVPESSAMLTKPTGEVNHDGGKLFDRNSREYATILAWIRAGSPAPRKEDPKIRSLSLLPGPRVLKVGETQQLLAIAEFEDGSRRDVTWLTRFDSGDAGVLPVTESGKIKALRNGEAAIRAAFLTEVAVTVFTMPFEKVVDRNRFTTRNNFIDDAVFPKLEALRIEPSDPSNDSEFIRRVFLDSIGTLPTAEEVKKFLADPAKDKRAKLIDSLLERPEFIDYWTLFLGDLLQNRRERDHDVRGVKGVRAFQEWLRKEVAADRPWDELARTVLTSSGSATDSPAIGYYIVTVGENRDADRSEVVASVAQAFLGTRIGCAQCHNHPLERYTQDDYYHFAGFFSRIQLDRKEPKTGVTVLKVGHHDENRRKELPGVRQPRTNEFLKPQALDRSPTDLKVGDDPRIKLVDWMVNPKNEYFSGAIVNRIWKHYLGTGMVEPVDDLRATNPPTNPELWKALNREFVTGGYRLKPLMRTILNSRTYQLTSTTRPDNETDTRFYSHYNARRLPAEVLLDAVSQCTDIPESFPGYPQGIRAIQLPDPGLKSYFLGLFGRSDRVSACACERSGDVTMPQLLHLQNGEGVISRIRSADGRLSRMLKEFQDDKRIIQDLFLTTLARLPSDKEKATITELLARGDSREDVFRDLLWALMNSKVFAFNH